VNKCGGSHFLADLNNFKPDKNEAYKEAILNLANFVMIMWEDDQTIIPPISSHMGFYILGQDNLTAPLQVLEAVDENSLRFLKKMRYLLCSCTGRNLLVDI
jgi:hypothetical protein